MKSKLMSAMMVVLTVTAMLLMTQGCTENQRAAHLGGSQTVRLPQGQRLIAATWKGKEGDNLWYLTEDIGGAIPRTLTFAEDSSYGLLNGKVVFIESK